MINPQWQQSTLFVIGFRRWKAYSLHPILCRLFAQVHYFRHIQTAQSFRLPENAVLAAWGANAKSEAAAALASQKGLPFIRIEDGFLRSVGLGSDLIAPSSLVLDECGIYFNPNSPSSLEKLLNTQEWHEHDLQRALAVRQFIVQNRLSKYNTDLPREPKWLPESRNKQTILVPGQVEDDASIRLGAGQIKTNLQLLAATRKSRPDAFIVYKPHPDVLAKNRSGSINDALRFADAVETETAISTLLDYCDEIHTITSQSGFDALLRDKTVCVYGQPFYAGWGLTQDFGTAFEAQRRRRTLTIDQLTAAALLHYPIYFDWQTLQLCDCETVMRQLAAQRDELLQQGRLHQLKYGRLRRFGRKVSVLSRAFLTRWQK